MYFLKFTQGAKQNFYFAMKNSQFYPINWIQMCQLDLFSLQYKTSAQYLHNILFLCIIMMIHS